MQTKGSYASTITRRLATACLIMCCVFSTLGLSSLKVNAISTNLSNAMSKYGVSEGNVIEVGPEAVDSLGDTLKRAGSANSGKTIVYLKAGNYDLKGEITVPKDVILVADEGSVITPSGSFIYLVKVEGSMYGGTYNSNYKNQTTIKLQPNDFSNLNGQLDNLVITQSNNYGIVAQGSKNSEIYNCDVTKCKQSGISILKPTDGKAGQTNVAIISNCNVSDNGTAGINLSFADVGTIEGCTINNNIDKAVSTNSDNSSGCHIGAIRNCTIKYNVTNGVHIKPNCTLDHFVGNYMEGNDDGIIAAAITKEKTTKGKSIVKDVSGNIFKGSKTSQIEAQGKGASITVGDNNQFISGKQRGILVMNSGKVTVSGSNNIFKGNVKGIEAQSKGSITITGSNNQIIKNKDRGVYVASTGKVTIKGSKNKISGNKKGAIYCAKKGVVQLKKVKISGKIYKQKGAKVTKK